LTEGRGRSRQRAYALIERAGYHMNASEHAQALGLARQALPIIESLGIEELRARAFDVVGSSRLLTGDIQGGLDDSNRAVELARASNAFSRLIVAELNLHFSLLFLGRLAEASDMLFAAQRDVEVYGTAGERTWLRVVKAHHAMLAGHWDEADQIVDATATELEARAGGDYMEPACLALRAWLVLPRGEIQAASADSEKALARARRVKDPQVLGQVLVIRAMVLLAQGRREQAASLAAEFAQRGSVLLTAMVDLHFAVTPIEYAWLLRDLGREAELSRALASARSSPWVEAAKAIAAGNLEEGIEIVSSIGAPSIEAYTRLRTGEAMVAAGEHADARPHLAQALAFYRSVGATRYIADAEAAIAAGPEPSPESG
jgi:tetratricopeptide (TPR) repeat protein